MNGAASPFDVGIKWGTPGPSKDDINFPVHFTLSNAANDLTLAAWDPVSKQPEFKVAAVALERLRAGDGPAPAPTNTASAPAVPDGC